MAANSWNGEPGTKMQTALRVGAEVEIPATVITGKEPGKTLVVTAGVHGCEYVGILAAQRLAEELAPEEIQGRVIIVPLLNPTGFYHGRKQIMPEDGKNLNREFPGDETGSHAQQVAAAVEQELYPRADFLIDLHGGDHNERLTPLVFFPVAAGEEIERQARAAAQCLTVPLRVTSTARNGLYSWAAQRGVPALLLERGCEGRWSREEVEADVEDLRRLMIHLGMLQEELKPLPQKEIRQAVYEETQWDGFWFPAVDRGEEIREGQLLGTMKNEGGVVLREYRAAFDGLVLYGTFALGVRAGDPLVAYGRG